LDIKVSENDVEKALRALKRQLQREGVFQEISRRRFYGKSSETRKTKRKRVEKKRLQTLEFKKAS
jgi:small subunit ribosomal protein S21